MTEQTPALAVVTSCTGYGKYLSEWARSILAQTRAPAAVVVFTHGSVRDERLGRAAVGPLTAAGLDARHVHEPTRLAFATARNVAVAHARTDWVMHLDADDTLMPHALADVADLVHEADVVALGYETMGTRRRNVRRYHDADGLAALAAPLLASGCSPFRRSFWARAPYRPELLGAWDTGLWIDFARLGARFRATARPAFWYRVHDDSIYQTRTRSKWQREFVQAQIKALRRGLPVPRIAQARQPNASSR